ncbi:DUF4855 domain-containing protein [Alistipes sp.]|uniref:DUF4855 domain-containing protein n=1 Tax=Alistipes sp. TaxID=1872444 RepID=UPI0025C37B41|nr:DUF4855 domain-containing protein [Alistipes sp.]
MKIVRWIIAPLCCLLSLVCCGNGNDGGSDTGRQPALDLKIYSWNGTYATFEAQTLNATHVRALCLASGAAAPTAAEVCERGTRYTGTRFTVEGLEPRTSYVLYAVACDDAGACGSVQQVSFTAEYTDPQPYAWESARTGILSYTDLVLCYGGSTHRTPFAWKAERFAPMVSYTDPEGKEHWLFDSFLCIEFQMGSYSINLGQHLDSGKREQWEELLDYWFGNSATGVGALEAAVAAAAERLGTPSEKRKVVMVMPDPIIYEYYDGTKPSTTYWGEVNGREMDFSKAADRITAYKWYINEVRRHFDEAGYKYIELAGFYIVSEDLATPGDGWNPELKRWEEVIPSVAEYLHALNESLAWIPYNRAAGYTRWEEMGIDYAYMQPNIFWGKDLETKTWSRFFSDVKANDLAMELEFDDAVLEKTSGCEAYRTRLREYMSGARSNGIYGTKPLAYYQGQDTFYNLATSSAAGDRAIFDELCQFVLNNPLRKQ